MLTVKFRYKPDSFRTPIINYQVDEINRKIISFAERLLVALEKDEIAKAKVRSAFLGQLKLTPYIPFFLNVILHESKRPEDIIEVAIQMRNSSSAKRFRRWCREIDASLRRGENIDKHILEVQNVVNGLAREFKNTDAILALKTVPEIAYSFKDGVSSTISITSLVMKGIDIMVKLLKARHLLFIHDLRRRSSKIGSLNKEFERLFERGLSEDDLSKLVELQKSRL